MKALLTAAALALVVSVMVLTPKSGAAALLLCVPVGAAAGYFISRQGGTEKKFLLRLFMGALLVRVAVGTAIFYFNLQEFFGGDAYTYDALGSMQLEAWYTGSSALVGRFGEYAVGWGMAYLVAAIYYLIGQNMLAVQFVNAVLGAATAPLIYLCAYRIFRNAGVAKTSALFVAFYPSLILWSSQGLKDGPIVFMLALSMFATLKLDEKFSLKWGLVLLGATFGVFSMRFYVFYMMVVAVGGSFLIGMKTVATHGKARQLTIVIALGMALMYLGVLRSAGAALEHYGSLESVQRSRADLAGSAASGYGREADVSTTGGALSAIPVGMLYLLFAPFPWQLASLRQSITLPEMVVWWASFPLLCVGLWFTLKHRLRQALPILIFTMMLTLAYSVFQGNVGTAYRQRSQLLVFYFIFVSVGYVLMKERREDRKRQVELDKEMMRLRALQGATRRKQGREWEVIADNLSEKVGF
jgi:4-amino-4-deoxy-L-arabinose transferase-like glycosyltransferase